MNMKGIIVNCVRLIVGAEPNHCLFNPLIQTLELKGVSLKTLNEHLIEIKVHSAQLKN